MAGVGNIYADEALFRAGIHPLRAAGTLSTEQLERLREGVIDSLSAGIDARGASIDDFRHVDGVKGSFQDRFQVHLRAGEPCIRCGTPIVKISAAGRGTYVCEHCQRPPRGRRAAAGRAGGRGEVAVRSAVCGASRGAQAASSSSRRPSSSAAWSSA